MINSVAEYLAYTERGGGANPSSSFLYFGGRKIGLHIRPRVLKHLYSA